MSYEAAYAVWSDDLRLDVFGACGTAASAEVITFSVTTVGSGTIFLAQTYSGPFSTVTFTDQPVTLTASFTLAQLDGCVQGGECEPTTGFTITADEGALEQYKQASEPAPYASISVGSKRLGEVGDYLLQAYPGYFVIADPGGRGFLDFSSPAIADLSFQHSIGPVTGGNNTASLLGQNCYDVFQEFASQYCPVSIGFLDGRQGPFGAVTLTSVSADSVGSILVTPDETAVTPEPGTWVMVGTGLVGGVGALGGLGAVRRRLERS